MTSELDYAVMTVTIRLFAGLRERAGVGSIDLELAAGASVSDALRSPLLADLMGGLRCVMAVNRRYAGLDDLLSPGDELALVPPVSGGER
jgi:molybdopterin synthase catalytic subunit